MDGFFKANWDRMVFNCSLTRGNNDIAHGQGIVRLKMQQFHSDFIKKRQLQIYITFMHFRSRNNTSKLSCLQIWHLTRISLCIWHRSKQDLHNNYVTRITLYMLPISSTFYELKSIALEIVSKKDMVFK